MNGLLAIVMLGAMILLTVSGNVLLKYGANLSRSGGTLLAQLNWATCIGLICFFSAMGLYLLLLRAFPLHIVQAFASFQFVLIVVASAFFLGETISVSQWIGFLLISSGIVVVGLNSQ